MLVEFEIMNKIHQQCRCMQYAVRHGLRRFASVTMSSHNDGESYINMVDSACCCSQGRFMKEGDCYLLSDTALIHFNTMEVREL
jgi:hypothetical protein